MVCVCGGELENCTAYKLLKLCLKTNVSFIIIVILLGTWLIFFDLEEDRGDTDHGIMPMSANVLCYTNDSHSWCHHTPRIIIILFFDLESSKLLLSLVTLQGNSSGFQYLKDLWFAGQRGSGWPGDERSSSHENDCHYLQAVCRASGGNRKDLSEEASAEIDLKGYHGSQCILEKDLGSQWYRRSNSWGGGPSWVKPVKSTLPLWCVADQWNN